jgi:cytidylate kinase
MEDTGAMGEPDPVDPAGTTGAAGTPGPAGGPGSSWPVVTLSASFGAGGALIGPAVATELEVPFVDRAIPRAVAAELGCSLEEALVHDGRAEHGIGRLLAGAARLPDLSVGGIDIYLPERDYVPDEEFVVHTERVIKEVAGRSGGVILGRAGALVLADHPYALHVRLDAFRPRRLERVRRELRVSTRDAQRMLDDNDRARTAYVKHFYRGADPADPGLYHLVLDSTRLPTRTCVDLIAAAARSRSARA